MKQLNLQKHRIYLTEVEQSRGFSTLLIVIILGGVSLSLALVLSTSSMWSIVSSRDSNISNKAQALVAACAEVSLETIRENNTYTGDGIVTLNGNICTYTVANSGGTTRSINISGVVNDITRKLVITTSSFNPLVISSWQEVP